MGELLFGRLLGAEKGGGGEGPPLTGGGGTLLTNLLHNHMDVEAYIANIRLFFLLSPSMPSYTVSSLSALQRTANLIYVLIFWELHGLSPNFHIHVSVSDLYIPTIVMPILLQQEICGPILGIYKSLTDT